MGAIARVKGADKRKNCDCGFGDHYSVHEHYRDSLTVRQAPVWAVTAGRFGQGMKDEKDQELTIAGWNMMATGQKQRLRIPASCRHMSRVWYALSTGYSFLIIFSSNYAEELT